jgi:hypothetical protein
MPIRDKLLLCLNTANWCRGEVSKLNTQRDKLRSCREAREQILYYIAVEGLEYPHELLYPYGEATEVERCIRCIEETIIAKQSVKERQKTLNMLFDSLEEHIKRQAILKRIKGDDQAYEIYL